MDRQYTDNEARIPKDLQELADRTCTLENHNRSLLGKPPYADSLYQVIRTYGKSTEKAVIAALADCYLNYAELLVTLYIYPTDSWATIDSAISFLIRNKQVARLVENETSANALACICMTRVKFAYNVAGHPPGENVGDVLEQWTGTTIDKQDWSNLEAITCFLYGPSTWVLYKDEISSGDLGQRTPWLLGLPLSNSLYEKPSLEVNSTIDLPTTLDS